MAFFPYLGFHGDAKAAFEFYRDTFGGELFVMTNADVPEGQEMPGVDADFVVHAALTLADGSLLMGGDMPGDTRITGACVHTDVADAAAGRALFDTLRDGGSVEVDYGESFFSPGFGMCTDRFGVPWIVNAAPPRDAAAAT